MIWPDYLNNLAAGEPMGAFLRKYRALVAWDPSGWSTAPGSPLMLIKGMERTERELAEYRRKFAKLRVVYPDGTFRHTRIDPVGRPPPVDYDPLGQNPDGAGRGVR
jgi:hypothetical protein